MQEKTVTAKKTIDGTPYEATVPFNVPETLEEASKVWGEEVTLSNAVSAAVVSLQAGIRRRIDAGAKATPPKDIAEITDIAKSDLANWKPGVAAAKTDPVDALLAKFDGMSEEQKGQLIAMLKAKAAGVEQKEDKPTQEVQKPGQKTKPGK